MNRSMPSPFAMEGFCSHRLHHGRFTETHPRPVGFIASCYPARTPHELSHSQENPFCTSRYSPSPNRPWAGRSPVQLAVDTARVAGLLETATAGELGFTQTQMLTPRRAAGDFGVAETLNPDTLEKIVSAFSQHMNTGSFILPADLTAQRLGPEPPDSFPLLRDRFENSILAMHGIPPALIASTGNAGAMREGFRIVLHSLLKPLGALVVEELQLKLHRDAALSFDSLRAGDITGTSRAFGSLVTAGLSPAAAAAIVGIDDVEVSA